jgi:hypothetical protein
MAGSEATALLIDDFEGPTALHGWRLSGGEPGSLSLGAGHHGHGAVLAYRGASAEALWTPPSALPKLRSPAVSLWIRVPLEVEAFLVAKDTSGQTLHYPIPTATLEHPRPGDWKYAVIPLAAPTTGRLRGRLAGLGILVQPRGRAEVQGSVGFDELRLWELAESFLVTATSEAEPPPPESAALAPRLGVNIHVLRDDHALDLARDAGFRFVRMDLLWADVERNGRYRFFAYDALLRSLEVRGMGALWILDYGHPDHGGGAPRAAQDVAAFGRFAEAVADHFKGRDVRYEIWNEPNTDTFWKPSPNASEYGALLREAVAAIRRADPAAKVASGGMARFDLPFLSRAVTPAVAANLSAIGIHPYRTGPPETVVADLALAREWAAGALGRSIEIWDTEWGYSSTDNSKEGRLNGHAQSGRMRQAVFAVRELLTVWAAGFPLAVWYDLRDDGTSAANPEHNYGLLDSDGNEKPAMQAIRTLMDAVKGRQFAGLLLETPVGVHAMRLEGSADTVLIVWADRPDARRKLEVARRDLISATDVIGRAVKAKEQSAGIVVVELDDTNGPVYLRWSVTRAG